MSVSEATCNANVNALQGLYRTERAERTRADAECEARITALVARIDFLEERLEAVESTHRYVISEEHSTTV